MENFDFARKVFFIFDFNAFKFDLWFYDWIWGHSTASNQLQLWERSNLDYDALDLVYVILCNF